MTHTKRKKMQQEKRDSLRYKEVDIKRKEDAAGEGRKGKKGKARRGCKVVESNNKRQKRRQPKGTVERLKALRVLRGPKPA